MLVLHAVYFEPPVNSSTIQELHFTVLSRTLSFHFQDQTNFQDFPGLENPGKNPRLSSMCGNPVSYNVHTGTVGWRLAAMASETNYILPTRNDISV